MPNWVFNTIKINGKNEDIEKFLSDASKHENGKLYFSSWIPVPETFKKYDTTNHPNGDGLEMGKPIRFWEDNSPIVTQELIDEYKVATKEQMEHYGVVGWYDYNYMTYGCGDDCPLDVESQSDGEMTLTCSTLWSPPISFFRTMSERYPNLTFRILSSKIEWKGEYLLEKGVVTELFSKVYTHGELIEMSEETEGVSWTVRKWHRLMYEINLILYRFRTQVERITKKLGIPIPEEDLPF